MELCKKKLTRILTILVDAKIIDLCDDITGQYITMEYGAVFGSKLWSCIRVKTVRKSFDANSRSDLMTYVLIDAFLMLALLLISS